MDTHGNYDTKSIIPAMNKSSGFALDILMHRYIVYMHYMTIEQNIVANCLCQKVRAAARSVTSAYDEALRPAQLRASQLAVLAAVAGEGSLSISALAQQLSMDRTTLSRNLGPLRRAGLIHVGSEGWRRSRNLEITKKGRSRLEQAIPFWRKAQEALRDKLGNRTWENVREGLNSLRDTQ